MKRRGLALSLAAIMILGSLAGCGQSAQTDTGSQAAAETQSASQDAGTQEAAGETAAAEGAEEAYDPFGKYEEEVTFSVACSSTNLVFDSSQDGYASLDDNVWTRAYKDQLGINLDYIWTAPDDDYTTKWNVSITAGDIPDVAIVPESIYTQLLEGGYVEDMTEYYENYASDTYKAAVEADGGICMSYVTKDGRIMGLPHPGATPDNLEFLYIRKDWLDELGLPVPKTLDELLDTARAFQEAGLGGENTIGMAASGDLEDISIGDLGGIFEAYGVHRNIWVEDEDGNLVFGDVQPEVKEVLQTLQDMYKEGLISPDFAAADFDSIAAQLSSGQCGITYGAYWVFANLYNTETMELDDWIVTDGVTVDGSPCVASGDAAPEHFIFVKKGIEHPEAVVKMLNLQFELIDSNYGTYGAYEYETEDGAKESITSLYYCLAPFMRAPWKNSDQAKRIINALETGDDSEVMGTEAESMYLDCKTVIEENSNDPKYAFSWGIFGPGGVYDIVDQMWEEDRIYVNKFTSSYSDFALQNMTNMREILDAEYVKIIMGADIDNFDKAVETWYSTGGDRITEEVNEWYQSTK